MEQRCYLWRVPENATEMQPFCRPGDDIIVCPLDEVLFNKHAVLCDLEETRCLIRYLLCETTTHWIVGQYNPKRHEMLEKKEWPTVKKVCGLIFNPARPFPAI